MTLVYGRESVREVWDEAQPLLVQHWAEIALYPDIPLAPNFSSYCGIEDNGMLRVYTAREDSALVGYAAFIVLDHLHYAGSKQANQDVLFLLPSHRNAGNGNAFIAYAEDQLRDEGCQAVTHHVKHHILDFGPLLAHRGYADFETLWIKRLDR